MYPFRLILLLVLSVTVCDGFGQEHADTAAAKRITSRPYRVKAIKLLAGAHLQNAKYPYAKEYTRKYLEIGVHKTRTAFALPHGSLAFGHGVSAEVSLERKPVYGFKYGAWFTARFLAAALNGVYYTNMKQGNLKIRPELGIGAEMFRLTFGFNIPTFFNNVYPEVSQSNVQLSLNVLFKLKTLERKEFY